MQPGFTSIFKEVTHAAEADPEAFLGMMMGPNWKQATDVLVQGPDGAAMLAKLTNPEASVTPEETEQMGMRFLFSNLTEIDTIMPKLRAILPAESVFGKALQNMDLAPLSSHLPGLQAGAASLLGAVRQQGATLPLSPEEFLEGAETPVTPETATTRTMGDGDTGPGPAPDHLLD